MNDEKSSSRVNKYDKRRKMTKTITLLVGVAIGLVILLIGFLVFGDKDKSKDESINDVNKNEETTENEKSGDSSEEDDSKDKDKDQESEKDDEEKDEESEGNEDVEIEQIPAEAIEDSNVIEAYTANWQPVGTSQQEPHATTFDKSSQDWKEMMQAIAYALDIEEDAFVNHWIGNGGDQRVNGHVEASGEHFTVYLEWEEAEGWKPIKVERVERFIHPKQAN